LIKIIHPPHLLKTMKAHLAAITAALLAMAACNSSSRETTTVTSSDSTIVSVDSSVVASAPDKSLAIDTSAILTEPKIAAVGLAATSILPNSKKTGSVQVVIQTITGYGADEPFARATAKRLEQVLNSTAFKKAIASNSYTYSDGLTPTQLYERIMTAHEQDGPGGKDGVVDLRLRVINLKEDGAGWMAACEPGSRERTVGIDGAGTGIAAICPQWLKARAAEKDTASLAAHFIHEYMHVLGFEHRWPGKYKSVPYKVQTIVESLIDPKNS
jgi:hypothetical protein